MLENQISPLASPPLWGGWVGLFFVSATGLEPVSLNRDIAISPHRIPNYTLKQNQILPLASPLLWGGRVGFFSLPFGLGWVGWGFYFANLKHQLLFCSIFKPFSLK